MAKSYYIAGGSLDLNDELRSVSKTSMDDRVWVTCRSAVQLLLLIGYYIPRLQGRFRLCRTFFVFCESEPKLPKTTHPSLW